MRKMLPHSPTHARFTKKRSSRNGLYCSVIRCEFPDTLKKKADLNNKQTEVIGGLECSTVNYIIRQYSQFFATAEEVVGQSSVIYVAGHRTFKM